MFTFDHLGLAKHGEEVSLAESLADCLAAPGLPDSPDHVIQEVSEGNVNVLKFCCQF